MRTKVSVVSINSDVTLPHIPALRDRLKRNIDKKPVTVVNLSEVREIDLSGIQLLLSAQRYAASLNKEFHIVGDVSLEIAERMVQTGFIAEATEDGKELEQRLLGAPDLRESTNLEDASNA